MIKKLRQMEDFELIEQRTYYVRRKSKEEDIMVSSDVDKAIETYELIMDSLCQCNKEHGFADFDVTSPKGANGDRVCKECWEDYKKRGWKIKKKLSFKKRDKKYYGKDKKQNEKKSSPLQNWLSGW